MILLQITCITKDSVCVSWTHVFHKCISWTHLQFIPVQRICPHNDSIWVSPMADVKLDIQRAHAAPPVHSPMKNYGALGQRLRNKVPRLCVSCSRTPSLPNRGTICSKATNDNVVEAPRRGCRQWRAKAFDASMNKRGHRGIRRSVSVARD